MAAPTFSVVNDDVPAEYAAAVTPSDVTDLTQVPRALYVGTTGNLNVDMIDGTTVLFSNVPTGIFPVRVKRVRATNTTASNIVALY